MSLGAGFLVTGAVGLFRLPDLFCRLHAVTKADTLGLGLLALGLAFHADSKGTAVLLILIWLLLMVSSAVSCQLLARFSVSDGKKGEGDA